MKDEKCSDALRVNRIGCFLAVFLCTLLCVFVFWGVASQMLDPPNALIQEVGEKSFRMFTILSNMLMGVSAAMCIPFAVEGIRHRDYHLPRWIMILMFMGTNCVALTFLLTLTILSPEEGFVRMMLYSNDLPLHTLCPLLAIVLFIFVNSFHTIRFKATFLAVLPVVLYAIVYVVMVFVIGEDHGGWRDQYQIHRLMTYLPLYVIVALFILISFGVATLLRLAHNAFHRRRKADFERFYQNAPAFDFPDIASAIRALAAMDRPHDLGGDLTVPRRVFRILEKKYRSGLTMEEMSGIYLAEYLR